MKQRFCHFMLAALLYCVVDGLAKRVFVMPPAAIELTPFLPPLLGLAWGPVGVCGAVAGEIVSHIAGIDWRGIVAVLIGTYLPHRLWHTMWVDKDKPSFAFSRTVLRKFIVILLIAAVVETIFLGLSQSEEGLAQLFDDTSFADSPPWVYLGLLLLNDFNLALFFGIPIFFVLIASRFPFYMPSSDCPRLSESDYEANRLAVVMLFTFFFGLFALLDLSGVFYDLDKIDTWLKFVGEVLTAMNFTVVVLLYVLMKYRHSIMTNLMMMELATLFIVAFMLGSISFVALSRAIDDHVRNDLEKMSVIYRERLARTFNDTIMSVNSMSQLAEAAMESRQRFAEDAAYRQNYLGRMERGFSAIAANSPGSVGFYMLFPSEGGSAGFLCTRAPKNWGSKLPDFSPHEGADTNRYHLPEEKYLAKLSEPYLDENTGKQLISYVAPLHKDGKFVGIVGIDIDFGYIIHEIKRMSVYENGFVRLLDKNGEVLYANQPWNLDALEKNGFFETETYLSTGVWLAIAAFARDIYADRNDMLLLFVVGTLAILILVSLFSIWLAQREIRPLMQITEAARKIAAGDLALELPDGTKNELGILVNSIREMVPKLETYVYRDKLTGLRNAAAYMRETVKLDAARQTAGQGDNLRYGVVVFDANYLKRTNDTYGHEAGNALLRGVAHAICIVFAHSPVFRIGGDEFAAILQNHDYEHREELLVAFDEQLAQEYFEVEGEKLPLSVARGLGVYRPGMEYAAVFKEADDAMYRHKTELKAHRE